MEIKEKFLPRFSVDRPVTVLTTLLAFLVIGFIAYNQIWIELFPRGFTPPWLGLWVPYRETSPREVEDQVTKPTEEILQTVRGIREVHSYSGSNGCWIWLRFSNDTDMDIAYMLVRERMDRLMATELPSEIEHINIRKFGDDDDPILWFGVSIPEEIEDSYFILDRYVKRALQQVDGVANVELWGVEEKIIQILIDQDKVKAHRINTYQLIQQLRRDNFSLSSGYVFDGAKKIYVRSVGRYKDVESVRNIRIKGQNLYLKDIADIVYDVPVQRRWRQRVDRKSAASFGVYKESMANTVDLSERLLEQLDGIQKNSKVQGMAFNVFFNQGSFITDSIDNLLNAAIWGSGFAFLILYFFLRRLKMTLIINLAIPLSLLMTVTVLYFYGWTLNLITMMGLMVSVGLVVDNSIVIVENIYRLKNEGMNRRDASVKGASEVMLAITMATLTTVVVFLPLILMNDDIGFAFYMFRIGLPVIIALLASLFVALVFIPLATTRIVSRREVGELKSIAWSSNKYERMLNWTLSHRIDTTIIILLLMISMGIPMSKVKMADTDSNINDVRIILDMPSNYRLEDADRLVDKIEEYIYKRENIYDIKTVNSRYTNNWGRVRIFMNPPKETSWYQVAWRNFSKATGLNRDSVMTREEIIADIKENLPVFPGVTVRTSWREEGGNTASLSLNLYGDDTMRLVELSEEVERRLKQIPEIVSVETDREKGVDEIQVLIRRDQAKKYGIGSRVIAGTISYALRGIELPEFQTPEREIDMRIQMRDEDVENLQQLKNLTFLTSSGSEISLASLADFRIEKGLGQISRRDGKTSLRIDAYTTEDDMGEVFRKVDQVLAGFTLPRGYSWTKGDRFQRMQESNDAQQFAVILAITFVFLLMGVLFESFILPLSVIISIPLSFFGAYWLLYITGTTFDIMAMIGLIILIGIVVNNAIVLIDMINRLRLAGYSRHDAIITAGRHRFRPILMTAFTTIFGLLPMAAGNANLIGMPYAPLGRVMIGGLLTSTALTLIAVPLFYTFFDDVRIVWSRIQTLALSSRKEPVS